MAGRPAPRCRRGTKQSQKNLTPVFRWMRLASSSPCSCRAWPCRMRPAGSPDSMILAASATARASIPAGVIGGTAAAVTGAAASSDQAQSAGMISVATCAGGPTAAFIAA